ncbi:hypothetical protein GCM10010193_12290 [Kitasatospora atroaurantiaca]|uniref:Uncharacterized protein n=1 Tax=Kitasatospora atroaurantiaca TaxID=285545 RepID=A0A561EQM5_9ACTN|nr:hypothetical protein [Kitasatospora atroaurantiaca]TWE17918.1 hypothetical protein FB465_2962 [Kitasatospora atroaurantiaca]
MDGDDGVFGELAADLDPDAWVWLPGVDYAAGWREARDAADELNEVLAACGVDRRHLRAVADTDAHGQGWVRLVGVPYGWHRLGELLQLAVEEARRESA